MHIYIYIYIHMVLHAGGEGSQGRALVPRNRAVVPFGAAETARPHPR